MTAMGRNRSTIAGVKGTFKTSWRFALALVVMTSALAACGSTTGTPPPGSTPTVSAVALPTITAAPITCPTAGTVGSALGMTLPAPVGVKPPGGSPFPPGATAEVCDYHTQTLNVIIEVVRNITPSDIALFSIHFPVAYKSVSGVGDQARSFSVSIGGGRDNEGLVATKGSTLVAITATATPASLAQLEALVNQLL
jgi:hypothetical protein